MPHLNQAPRPTLTKLMSSVGARIPARSGASRHRAASSEPSLDLRASLREALGREGAPDLVPGYDARASVMLNQVGYTYPGRDEPALAHVTAHVAPGEFVYLVGSSGSGKSTLLRLLYAQLTPTSGHAQVAGVNLNQLRSSKVAAYRRNLGIVFQDFKLLEHRNCFEQVAFALTVTGRRKEATDLVPAALARVGLPDVADRFPEELSGGEQQRIAIARALVTGPKLVIADEPTGNLDPDTSAGVMEVLQRINADGTTVVMATHDSTLVDATGHRVIELAEGRLVRDAAGGGYRDGSR